MANIIELKSRARAENGTLEAAHTGMVEGASAEIVIFPGVRIERAGFSLADRLNSMPDARRKRRQSLFKTQD